ncbi:unnamed protein product [Discosporangium mesarthrocarpum]
MGKLCTCTPLSLPPNPTGTEYEFHYEGDVPCSCSPPEEDAQWGVGRWDIGIWPIVDAKAAQRTSKHRPKGTKVFVPAMVHGERYKKLMIEAVISAIKACMPGPEGHTIFVQQDGATPHTKGGGSWRQSRRRWGVILS